MKHLYVLVLTLSSIIALSQNGMDHKSVTIFKNGSGFFIKEGTVETTDSRYEFTENLPQALFGTFWIHSPTKQLKSVESFVGEIDKDNEVNSLLQQAWACKDKRARIYIDTTTFYEGKIRRVHNKMITLQANDRWISFEAPNIYRVEYFDEPNYTYPTPEKKRILGVDFRNSAQHQPLEMMYLQHGINWLPNYLVALNKNNTAKVTLRALVMNNAEDIKDADLNFVVGVPHFAYDHLQSPVFSGETLVDFFRRLNGEKRGQFMGYLNSGGVLSNSIQAQTMNLGNAQYHSPNLQIGSTVPSGGNGFSGSGIVNGLAIEEGAQMGSNQEDLYFYTVNDVSVKKGGSAYFDVFEVEIPIRHIYEIDLEPNPGHAGAYYFKEYDFDEVTKNKVFHSIEIENKTESPLTTGTAMVTSYKDGTYHPICQDKLKYTPPKGKALIRVSESIDVSAVHSEIEESRNENHKRVTINRRKGQYIMYDLVHVQGKIRVKNYKDR